MTTRDDARDKLLLAMSGALVQLVRAPVTTVSPADRVFIRDAIIGFQKELIKTAPHLAGPLETQHGTEEESAS